MFEGVYYFYLILGLGLGIIGVVYGIRLQMRQNFGKKLSSLASEKVPYSEYIAVLGEPKRIGSCADENGERCKTAVWAVPGASITVRFDKDDYAVELMNSLVTDV